MRPRTDQDDTAYEVFAPGVGLIQDDDRGLAHNRARQCNQLALAAGEHGVLVKGRLVTLGQTEDDIVNARPLGGIDDVLIREAAEAADVIGNGAGQKAGGLR